MKLSIPVPDELTTLAGSQGGVFTRPQVLETGVSQAMLDRQLRNGAWLRVAQGVYTASPPDFRTLCWAGIVLAASPAAVGGMAAAHLHGLCVEPPRITIWGERSETRGPWKFRRSPRIGRGTPPRVGPEDAVLEACAEGPADRILDLLSAALMQRLVSPPRLRDRAMELGTLRHRRLILSLLPELEAGVQSTLENHFLHQVLRPHGLPDGERQVSVSVGTRSDVLFAEYCAIVELDGRRGHEGDAKWRDAARDNRHLLAGYATLRFGWHDVVLHPCRVASMVAALIGGRGWPGIGGAGQCRRCGVHCVARPAADRGEAFLATPW